MKIIDSDFNGKFSTVTIQTKLGTFTGSAALHPNDMIIVSKFVGWRIAEQRALIKYYKAQIKKEKYIIQGINETILNGVPFDWQVRSEIRELINQHQNQMKDWENKIIEADKILMTIFDYINMLKERQDKMDTLNEEN